MIKYVVFYIEMVIIGVILFGKGDYFYFNQYEGFVVLQFGGLDLEVLVKCVKLVVECGYDEVNFNVGCFLDCV